MNEERSLDKYICTEDTTMIDAMSMIDSNGQYIVFSVDSKGRITGSLTDGDIRRWLIKGGSLDAPVSDASYKNCNYIRKRRNDDETRLEAQKKYGHTDRKVIPVVDDDHVIVDLIVLKSRIYFGNKNSLKENSVIIMAGGRGTRLQPFTKILPKPLIPIGGIPIVERIIGRFQAFGATSFYMTLNYRKEMIKAYFNDSEHDYDLRYVEEEKPLGTAGSIKLIKDKLESPVIVSNCDILVNADYGEILKMHTDSDNKMTIVSSVKKIIVPYGVLNTSEGGRVISIEEKPNMSYFINTGMYIIDPDIIDFIPDNSFFHMTDLTQLLIDKGLRVGTYPISEEAFLDMGELEEMKHMEEKLEARGE